MNDSIKLGAAVVVFLIGTVLIWERRSFETILIGAALVGIAGPIAYYLFAKVRNHKDSPEIDAMAKMGQDILDNQDKDSKNGQS